MTVNRKQETIIRKTEKNSKSEKEKDNKDQLGLF